MIKTKKNCSVCKALLEQPKKWEGRLAKQIYGSRFYMASSDYTLRDVWRDYQDKFSYESLLNHCKKHQFLTEKDFNERHLRIIAKEGEKTLVKQAIKSAQVWDKVIEKGMDDLNEGKMTLTPNHLLAAARDKSNYDLKHADQQLAMMDMVFAFTSGEGLPNGVKEETDVIEGEIITEGATDSPESREERSRAFYQSLAGDAAASGTD